jgi:hypothetical protein
MRTPNAPHKKRAKMRSRPPYWLTFGTKFSFQHNINDQTAMATSNEDGGDSSIEDEDSSNEDEDSSHEDEDSIFYYEDSISNEDEDSSNEDEDSSEAQQEEEEGEESSPPMHQNTTCDECGAGPLVGIRYKAKHIFDYDICELCMDEELDKTERDKYVAIETPVNVDIADALGPEEDNAIRSSSFRDAAEKIARNNVGDYAFLQLYDPEGAESTDSDGKDLQSALASNTHLRILHVHMCGEDFRDKIAHVARGVMSSTSIKRVFWCISKQDRKMVSEETSLALREMIEKNSVITALYLKRVCEESRVEKSVDPAEDAFAATIFEGLKTNTTLQKVRLDSYNVLSEKNKEILLGIVAKNRSMERAHVEFTESDSRLEVLLACNREKWMERLTDASVPRRDRLKVLLEARECKSVEPASAVYHLLRSFPDLLSEHVR